MSLIECFGKLFNSETNSDVSFVFTNASPKYYAHKLILGARSDVFNAMFYGDITKSTKNCDRHNSIEIVDIKPANFLQLLRLIYTDQISLNGSNFAEIVYATEKYNIRFFDSICVQFLRETLNKDNVFSYFQQCYVYENAASEECLMFIDWAIGDLVAKVEDLCEAALTIIVERDTLQIKEFDLFKLVMKWSDKNGAVASVSDAKKLKLESEAHDAERQKTMLPVFRKIRYPTMSLEEFGECYKLKQEYFPPADVMSIFQYLSLGTANDNLIYTTEKREFCPDFNDKLNAVRFSPIEYHRIYTCSEQCDFHFTVNKPITLWELHFTSFVVSGSLYRRTKSIMEELYNFANSFIRSPNIILLPNVQYELSLNICNGGLGTHQSHKIPCCAPAKQNFFTFIGFTHPYIIRKIVIKAPKNKNNKT